MVFEPLFRAGLGVRRHFLRLENHETEIRIGVLGISGPRSGEPGGQDIADIHQEVRGPIENGVAGCAGHLLPIRAFL